ncbi:MAG: phosphogluconate dehydrogenase (NAD(+)-dependent, decarboxylating) [Candidatus Zixiibacteriota bacterium]
MTVGFVGLGKMGLNMVTRLQQGGHQVVAFNRSRPPVDEAVKVGAIGASSLADMVSKLAPKRVVWVMVPSGDATETVIFDLVPLLSPGDILIDGGNSNFHDTKRRSSTLAQKGITMLDAGTSGGIWGLKVGYCLMVGGDAAACAHVEPIFRTLAPTDGYLRAGESGAGHYVKMIHNGIEYGMMQAYAEGFEILKASEYNVDLAAVAKLWNHGSVVRSWLLELAQRAFEDDPQLERLRGYVADSGEGRWTVQEAIDRDVPAVTLAYALMARFRSRQDDSFGAKVLAALRNQFGGHAVKEK